MKSLAQHIAESLAEENQTNLIAESKLADVTQLFIFFHVSIPYYANFFYKFLKSKFSQKIPIEYFSTDNL